ncbi:peroxisome- protein [Geranomyces variabilis]|nr:peroxisome- protein [Geranomyces variabilis]
MASTIGTPPPSPRQLKGRPQQPSPPASLVSSSPSSHSSLPHQQPPPPPPPPRPRPVPIAHDITSLLLSLQGLFQRLSPYVSPVLQSLAFVLTWQNKLLSASVVASWCMLVLLGWDVAAFHLPFLAAIIALGYAYAKRLGRGVSPPVVNPPPPSIPHLLHTLISATSSLHSAADRLDSFVTLVTFTRKSETASLALFRAVIVLYAIVAATVFCIGLRTVLLLTGVVALCWGSDFAQVAKAVAFIQIHDLSKQIGIEIQWADEDDDEDLAVVATTRDATSAEQDKVDAVRRGSESAARQLMGVPPKSSGMRKRVVASAAPNNADGTAAPVKRLVKVGPKGSGAARKPQAVTPAVVVPAVVPAATATGTTIVPPVRKSSSDGGPAMLAKSQAAAAAAAAIAAAAATAPVTVSTDDLAANNSMAQTSSPTELTAAESALSHSDSSDKAEQEANGAVATAEIAGLTTTTTTTTTTAATPRRPSATSSASSPEPQDRLKSRLEEVVRTSRGTPSPTAVLEIIPEIQDSAASDTAVAIAALPSVPDESNVSVDQHPDWALPSGDGEDEITDDFHRALTGESAAGSKLPLEQADDDELDLRQPIETDYMNVELDQATDAFHQQMMREEGEEEEQANTLDENHFLRRRRSCDSDLTIDALANFSDPRRSSYTATTQNFIGLPGSRKSRALSNTSQSTLSTLSSDTGSSTPEPAGMATGRFRSVSDLDAKMGRFYSITDPIPQQRALSNLSTSSLTASSSASPSPLSPTPSVTGSSSRSSIRGANRRPLNVVLSFDTYENQRWWVGVGWVPHLLPTERGAWTDHAGRKDLPKSSFDLPEFRREQLEKINQDGNATGGVDGNRPGSLPIPELPVDMASHRYAWDWDGPWHIDMLGSASGSTDDDGWEYGDNFWSGWKKRKTLKRVVRRRRWVRLARLYEVGRKRSVTFGGSFVFDKETSGGGGGGGDRAVFNAVTEEESQFRPSAAQLRQTFTPTWPEIDRDDMSSFNDEEYDLAQQQQARRDSSPAEYDEFEDDGGHDDNENIDDDDDDGTRIEYPLEEEYNDGGEEEYHHHHHHHHNRLPPPQQYELLSHGNDEHHYRERSQPRRRDTGPPQFTSIASANNAGGSARQHRSYAEPRYYPEQ